MKKKTGKMYENYTFRIRKKTFYGNHGEVEREVFHIDYYKKKFLGIFEFWKTVSEGGDSMDGYVNWDKSFQTLEEAEKALEEIKSRVYKQEIHEIVM